MRSRFVSFTTFAALLPFTLGLHVRGSRAGDADAPASRLETGVFVGGQAANPIQIYTGNGIGLHGWPVAQSVLQDTTCHDLVWEEDEFCGFDAYWTTGVVELNHDCLSELIDLQLFAAQLPLTGPHLSADINGDEVVNIFDLAYYIQTWSDSVPGCVRGGMQPDTLQGSLALSFSSDPTNIVSSAVVPTMTLDSLYCVMDGHGDVGSIEYCIISSPNVRILSHVRTIESALGGHTLIENHTDSTHSYIAILPIDPVPAGPIVVSMAHFDHTDDEPGWVRIESYQIPGWPDLHLRWNSVEGDRSYHFEEVAHVEVLSVMSSVEPVDWQRHERDVVLRGCRPNPFRSHTEILLELPAPAWLDLSVYGADGRKVTTLWRGLRGGGPQTFRWTGCNEAGARVAAGVYFARLEASWGTELLKLTLLQ
jgi:hypothetical protein